MPLIIEEVTGAAGSDAFLRLPAALGPDWTMNLLWEGRRFFDPRRNRFFDSHAAARFLALRDGRAVGRIAASIPSDGGPGEATFGFLACERDPATLAALLDAAGAWLRARGAGRMRGPLSFTINHDVGAQVSGFGGPPMFRMPRNPPWLPGMLEAAGLVPVQDVLACGLDLDAERHRARAAAALAARPDLAARLSVRRLRRRDWRAEVARLSAIYADAWADNWGAVAPRPGEVETLRGLLAPLMLSGTVVFAEWDGAPIGLCALVPNLEEATAGLGGRLLPFGWARVGAALAGRVGSARIPLLGIRRAFRGHPASALAVASLLAAAIGAAERRGWRRVEISWILEGNAAMRNTMARLPAPETGRWRLYDRALT